VSETCRPAGRWFVLGQRRPALRPGTIIVAEIRRLKPTKGKMPKRWNTLRISAWGFWVGLIYGVWFVRTKSLGNIMLAHGGSIRAESDLAHGSTFLFTLPTA